MRNDLIKLLNNKGYAYELRKDGLVIHHQGYVQLNSLKTLPEGIKFENLGNVDLESLETLPEGIKFENQGYVNLSSLKVLPEGIKFKNQGCVYLNSLKALPEGIKFENQGCVDLESLKALPEGIKFENRGSVYLGSLDGKKVNYLGKNISLKQIDGETMIVRSQKKRGEFTVYKAEFFKGSECAKEFCYVAERKGFYAHGESIKKAIEDCNFKWMCENLNLDDVIEKIKKDGFVTVPDYRLITGACQYGCDSFLESNGIKKDRFTVEEAINLTKESWGGSKFAEELT